MDAMELLRNGWDTRITVGTVKIDVPEKQEVSGEYPIYWVNFGEDKPSFMEVLSRNKKFFLSFDSAGGGLYVYSVHGDHTLLHIETKSWNAEQRPDFTSSFQVAEEFHRKFLDLMRQAGCWLLCVETSTLCFFLVDAETAEVTYSFESIIETPERRNLN